MNIIIVRPWDVVFTRANALGKTIPIGWTIMMFTLSAGNNCIMLYRVHLAREGFEMTTLVMIGTGCISNCKSDYHMVTTTTVLPIMYIVHSRHSDMDVRSIQYAGSSSIIYKMLNHPSVIQITLYMSGNWLIEYASCLHFSWFLMDYILSCSTVSLLL